MLWAVAALGAIACVKMPKELEMTGIVTGALEPAVVLDTGKVAGGSGRNPLLQ